MRSKIFVYRRGMHRADLSSQKTGCRIMTMSHNELAFAHLLEADPNVLRFTAQPAKFTFSGMRYTPDYLAEYACGTQVIWEVHRKKGMKNNYLEKLKLFASEIAYRANIKFCLFFNEDIDYKLIANLRYLRKYQVETNRFERILELSKALPSQIDIASADSFLNEKLGRGHSIRTLLYNGFFSTDLSQTITQNTKVWRVKGGC
ncbi:hypothetical protein [Pseudoalteromonas sp. T1lg24]|uniref:hypothetical protein n=1 Tax=Pseudoalteromonas sp. T1lg24 TaxID=2077099 RepID=UPI00131A3038|nr:hypothetical protein [Pseudoalteromonas sp. T1lg24]